MRNILRFVSILGGLAAAASAGPATQEAAAPTGVAARMKGLTAQKKLLDQSVDQQLAALRKQLDGIRDRAAKSADKAAELAGVKKGVDEAEAAYQKAKAEDAQIVAARKAADQAKAAHAKASAELKEAKAVKDAATTQGDVHALPEYAARNTARAAMDKLAKTDPGYEAARKAYEEALKAYEATKNAMPEAKAAEAARKAYDLASKALPEYKALQDADKACRAVEDERLAPLRKARDDARKAFDARADELAEADPEARTIEVQIKAIEALLKEAADKIKAVQKQ